MLHLYTGRARLCFETESSSQDKSVLVCEVGRDDTLEAIATRTVVVERPGDESPSHQYNTAIIFTSEEPSAGLSNVEHGESRVLKPGIQLAIFCKISGYSIVYHSSMMSEIEAENVSALFSHVLASNGDSEKVGVTVGGMNLSPRDMDSITRWNDRPIPQQKALLHDEFSKRARSNPDAEAINAWDGRMTYASLEQASDLLAGQLQEQGVSPGSWVLYCFEKSRWAVVSILAILKAGGACVPIDPRNSAGRVRQIIQTTKARHAVFNTQEIAKVFEQSDSDILLIDVLQQPRDNTRVIKSPDTRVNDPAFGLFTSGSTGVPKCIVISHSQLWTSMQTWRDYWDINAKTRVLQFASYSFDVSIADTFIALLYGGTLCIPSEEDRMSDLRNYVVHNRPNWATLTPTVARQLDPSALEHPPTQLLLVGEQLRESDIAPWIDAGVEVYNGYGPAENTFCSTVDRAVKDRPCNIGYGFNTRTWVAAVSEEWLVPVGSVGELVVESGHLASNYLGVPDAEKKGFIGDVSWIPRYGDDTSRVRRFYRTGDLVHYSEDGSLNFVGRADTQVKLGGQRIELSDIESHIRMDTKTREASVFLPKTGLLQGRLTALIGLGRSTTEILQSKMEPSLLRCPPDLVEHAVAALRQRVPSYMVPSIWIGIDYFPTSTSGKLHRVALQTHLEALSREIYEELLSIEEEADEETGASVSRDNGMEANLLRACSHVLNMPIEKLPLHKSFISIGGDSITAMQVSSYLRTSAKKEIRVKDLLSSSSLAKVALCITGLKGQSVVPTIQPGQRVALSPIQRLFFETGESSQSWNHYHQSFLLRLQDTRECSVIENALRRLIQRHPMLRARFEKNSNGEWVQYIPPEDDNVMSMDVLGALSPDEQETAMLKARESIDVVKGPLIHVQLFTENKGLEKPSILFILVHHAVIDLVSWRTLLEELETLLGPNANSINETYQEPVPFLAWSQLQSEVAKTLGPDKAIPHDPPVPEANFTYWEITPEQNVYHDVSERRISLGSALTNNLLYDCHKALRTEPIDVLLAAILVSFRRSFPDRATPAIFNEGHGREPWVNSHLDLSQTVGWFTTLSPVCLAEVNPGDVVDAVRRIKDYRGKTPSNGFNYFSSKYLHPEGCVTFKKHIPAEIVFNYEGRYQAMERDGSILKPHMWHAGEAPADQALDLKRLSLFEISAAVLPDGQLHLTSSWNNRMKHQDRVGLWLTSLLPAALMEIVSTLMYAKPRLTLADVSLLHLENYSALESLTESLLSIPGVESVDDIESVCPGFPMQDALALSQSRASDGAYEINYTWKVTPDNEEHGAIDVDRLMAAWKDTVARHEALRTVILEDNNSSSGVIQQVVLKSHEPLIIVLNAKDTKDALSTLDNYPPLMKNGLFADKQPLHRLFICTTPGGDTIVRLDINHVVIDGMSTTPLIQGLTRSYAGRDDGRRTGHGSMSAEFVQYIRDEQRKEESLAYWRTRLADVRPCLFPNLLNDVRAAPGQHVKKQQRRDSVDVPLDVDHSTVTRFLAELGVTLPALFQVIWALVLRIYTGNAQSVFGCLASGRDAPIEGLVGAVGNFISMLVCRVEFDGHDSPTVAEILRHVQDTSVSSLSHQASSLAEIQEAVGFSGRLFNSVLTCLPKADSRTSTSSDNALKFEEISMKDPSEFDVCLYVDIGEEDEGVSVRLEYRLLSIDDANAKNIAAMVGHVFSEVIHNPYGLPDEILRISQRDRESIFAWNQNLLEPAEECVHEMFAKRALEHPDRKAIHSWDGSLTYEELENLAQRLATHLASVGVGVGSMVPICYEKSMWTVVSILAVVKAGGCFALLDPIHPESRLWVIIKQIDPTILLCSPLTNRSRRFKMGSTDNVPSLQILEVDAAFIRSLPSSLESVHGSRTPFPFVSLDNDLYVVFTSGTTGTPKGAVATHRALATGLYNHAEACGMVTLGSSLRSLQFASYSFDASIGDIFTTFQAGGCLCVPHEEERSPDGIAAFIRQSGVNWAGLTPSFVSHLDPESMPTLKALCVAGEALAPSIIHNWSHKVNLINMYGPTEGTVACIANGNLSRSASTATIGRGYRATTWIVAPNDHDRLSPVGAVGELLIEGHILCRGYLGAPEQTSEVFISSPHWLQNLRPKSMLYKTGDLVRYQANGSISFIGRKDTQVKMNGQRFELGEIEHALDSSLQPSDGNVIVDLLKRGHLQEPDLLVAFVRVGGSGSNASEQGGRHRVVLAEGPQCLAKFRASLQKLQSPQSSARALPTYMVPQTYIPLEQLPMSAAGKVDRQALRKWCDAYSRKQLVRFASLGPLESLPLPSAVSESIEDRLARIWEKVLGVDGIDKESDFFRVGGNSTAAIALRAEARKAGLTLFVADIFFYPKLADMAQLLGGGTPSSPPPPSSTTQESATTSRKMTLSTPLTSPSPPPIEKESVNIGEDHSQVEEEVPTVGGFDEVSRMCNLPLEDIEDVFTSTPMQEALVALSSLPGAQASYAVHVPFELLPGLDKARFQSAWEIVAQVQIMLRSRIVATAQGTMLVVERGPKPMPHLTVPSLNEYLEQQRREGFGLGAPLFRISFVHDLGSGQDYFVWSAHHAIYDGWSLNMMWDAVVAAYRTGEAPPAGPPFKEFVKQLRLNTKAPESEKFWRETLVDEDEDGFQFPVVPVSHTPGTRCTRSLHFPSSWTPAVGATSAICITAAWAVTLARYSGARAVTFGAALWGRDFPMADIENMSGPTVTTIPRQLEVDPEVSVREYLQYVQRTGAAAAPHQHLGLHRIQALSPAAKSICDFTTLLVINGGSPLEWALEGLGIQAVPQQGSALYAYPMVVEVENADGDNLHFRVHCDPECIDESLMRRVMDQFDHNLKNICRLASSSPSTKLSNVMNGIAATHVSDLSRWNSRLETTSDTASPSFRVHQFVKKRAREQPELPAIVAHDGRLSYAELDRHIDVLAHRIKETGALSADHPFVCIYLRRSALNVVCDLAVSRAGGAFMPVNISDPEARLTGLVERAKVKLIIALPGDDDILDILSRHAQILRVALPELATESEHGPVASLEESHGSEADENSEKKGVESNEPAYLLHTSGTTGMAKAVIMEHGAWSYAITRNADYMEFNLSTRMLQFSTVTFDISLLEIFTTLYAGGCLCIPSEHERMNDLQNYIRSNNVNSFMLTPSVGKLLVPREIPSISFAFFGGEPLTKSLIEAWARPGVRLLNAYGPCELSVLATGRYVSPESPHERPITSIGKTVGISAWVVHPKQATLIPIGAVGELCLESPALARGYLDDPDRTSYSFRSDLLDHVPGKEGKRLYRTGDIVRYASDGSLEFVGRRDSQVKLRGQRIEIGEIEHHLHRFMSKIPGFREAAVHLYKYNPSTDAGSQNREPYLAAILAMDAPFTRDVLGIPSLHLSSADPDTSLQAMVVNLKRKLRSVLPHYMIPTQFVAVGRLPMGATGKLDRRFVNMFLRDLISTLHNKLPPPQESSTITEKLLCEWWSTVLETDAKSIRLADDFFSLGGNSILAMRLVGLARSSGYRLQHEDIFLSPTLSEMADRIAPLEEAEEKSKSSSTSRFDLLPAGNGYGALEYIVSWLGIHEDLVEDMYPCTPLQESLMAATARQQGAYIGFNLMEVPASRLAGLQKALATVFRAFAILRTRIVLDDKQRALQVVLKNELHWQEFPDVYAFRKDIHDSFGYGQALARVAIISPAQDDKVLPTGNSSEQRTAQVAFGVHHSAYDGTSISRVWRMLCQEYTGTSPRHSCSKETITPFKVFVRALLENSQPEESASFWQQKFQGLSSPNFPTATIPPGHQPTAIETIESVISLPSGNWRQARATAATVAYASWALTISHYTASHDVLFGATLSGREAVASHVSNPESIAGPTIITIPFRVAIDYESTIASFLSTLQKDVARGARFGQMMGLGLISRINEDCRTASRFRNVIVVQTHTTSSDGDMESTRDDVDEDLSWTPLDSPGFFPAPLVIELTPSADGKEMTARLGYDPVVLGGQLPHAILDTFTTLMANMCDAAPEAPLNQISALSTAHLAHFPARCPELDGDIQHSMTHVQSSPHHQYWEHCLQDLLQKVIEDSKNRQAIDSWDGSMSYAELDNLSYSLAKKLMSLGIGPEKAVCFLMEKSKWAIVTMLGIIKAGGHFVPLDPTWPAQRLKYIIESADASVVVTSSKYADICSSLPSIMVMADELKLGETLSLPVPVQPQNAAYILFTSGSTGTPKGVIMEHRSLCLALVALGKRMGFGEHSRVLQFSAYWFDGMLVDIFSTLIYGGCICIPKEEQRMSEIPGLVQSFRVNSLFLACSVARLVDPEAVPSLETLCIGGEVVLQSDLDRWASKLRFLVAYGPTETCIMSTIGEVKPHDAPNIIGVPVMCRAWVVNPLKDTELAPFGAVGELYIEGPTLARGYLHDEEKTRDSFVANAEWMKTANATWTDKQGDHRDLRRAYKTGDMVCLNTDGAICFVGRKASTQVKIRGQRVELVEIEEAIRQHIPASVTVCVDLLSPDSGATRVILGAVFGLGDKARGGPHDAEVQRYMEELTSRLIPALEASLPHHMIPELYVPLDQLPYLSTGKLDRKTLRRVAGPLAFSSPLPEVKATTTEQNTLTPNETLMRRLWANVLGLPDEVAIGHRDNFLGLGGDSIAAIKLSALLREEKASLTVAEILASPTLEAISAALEKCDDATDGKDTRLMDSPHTVQDKPIHPGAQNELAKEIHPVTEHQEMFLSGSQSFYGAHVVQFIFDLTGEPDLARLQAAFNHCADWFPTLRTQIHRDESSGDLVNDFAPVGTQVPWCYLTSDEPQSVLEGENDFPSELGRLLHRVTVVTLCNPAKSKLVWTLNHALYDAWSLKLMLNHIAQAYLDPGFRPSYGLDWGTFVKHVTRTAPRSAPFWKSYLSELEPAKLLFNYVSIKDPRQDCMATHRVGLRRQKRKSSTPASMLFAAWALTLARLSGRRDIVIGHLLTGRETPLSGIETCPGPTIARVPLRIQLPEQGQGPEADLASIAELVGTQIIQTMPHEHSGHAAIRDFIPMPIGADLNSKAPHAAFILGRLMLDLVIHPKRHLDLLPDSSLNMRQDGYRLGAPPPGGLAVECHFVEDQEDSGEMHVEVVTFWDRRAATEKDMAGLVAKFQEVLADN